MMDFRAWYTDTVDVYRVVDVKDGNLTRHERRQVLTGVPCRVYEDHDRAVQMSQTAASIRQESMLACENGADIRAFAGDPHYYFEPFGAVIPGLAHQEIRLLEEERVT